MRYITDNVMVLGNGFFNFYIVGKQEAALIECGTSAAVELFKKDWFNLKEKPQIKYIVAMHAHFDHVCGIPALKELFPEAKIVASEPGKNILARERVIKAMLAGDAITTDAYIKHQLLEKRPADRDVTAINIDMTVKDGDYLQLDNGLQLKMLTTPGHSPCSISAYLADEQIMFVSDAVGYRNKAGELAPTFFQDYDQYINSILKLQAYPTKVLGVAHGDIPLNEDAELFYQDSLSVAKEAFTTIKTKLENNYSEQELAEELFNQYIKDALALYPPDMMLGSMYSLIKNVKTRLS